MPPYETKSTPPTHGRTQGPPGTRPLALGDPFLDVLADRLRRVVADTPAAPAMPLVAAGGKRIRARLIRLAAEAVSRGEDDGPTETLLRAAAAVELAHLGSLVHDDIVDASATRRGVPSLHRQLGEPAAIHVGSALIHLASALIAPLPARLRRVVARAVSATCRGQIRELGLLFQPCDRRQRLHIMRDKTAAIFEMSVELGAALGGASDAERAAFRRFARGFGIAFQIADDIMDLAGDPAHLGRANGADLHGGIMTLPILLAAETDPRVAPALARLAATPTTAALSDSLARIAASEGIPRATRTCRAWLARSLAALEALPATRARRELGILAEGVVCAALRRGDAPVAIDVDGVAARTPLRLVTVPTPAALAAAPYGAIDRAVARGLARIDPALVGPIRPLLASPDGHRAFRDLLAFDRRRGAASRAARVAARAFALGQAATAGPSAVGDPTLGLCLTDCLYAAGLRVLATTSSREHEAVASRVLDHLSASAQRDTEARVVHAGRPGRGAPTPAPHLEQLTL